MTAFEKFRERMTAISKRIEESVELADEATAANRLEICYSCDHLLRSTKNCKICGCFVNFKTKLNVAECPIQKW